MADENFLKKFDCAFFKPESCSQSVDLLASDGEFPTRNRQRDSL
jgi:hypothetical protein